MDQVKMSSGDVSAKPGNIGNDFESWELRLDNAHFNYPVFLHRKEAQRVSASTQGLYRH